MVDLDQARRGDLLVQHAVGIDEKGVLLARDPGRNMIGHHVGHPVQLDEAIAGGEIDARLPLRVGAVRAHRAQLKTVGFGHGASRAILTPFVSAERACLQVTRRVLQRELDRLLERQRTTFLPRAIEGSVISHGRAGRGHAPVVARRSCGDSGDPISSRSRFAAPQYAGSAERGCREAATTDGQSIQRIGDLLSVAKLAPDRQALSVQRQAAG